MTGASCHFVSFSWSMALCKWLQEKVLIYSCCFHPEILDHWESSHCNLWSIRRRSKCDFFKEQTRWKKRKTLATGGRQPLCTHLLPYRQINTTVQLWFLNERLHSDADLNFHYLVFLYLYKPRKLFCHEPSEKGFAFSWRAYFVDTEGSLSEHFCPMFSPSDMQSAHQEGSHSTSCFSVSFLAKSPEHLRAICFSAIKGFSG